MTNLSNEKLVSIVVRLLLLSRSCLQLLWDFASQPSGRVIPADDHPFAAPPNPSPPDWCVCGRCATMPTAIGRMCAVAWSPALPHKNIFDQLSLTQMCYRSKFIIGQIFLIFDKIIEHLVIGKTACRQYVLGQYGYLGRGNRRIAPSCCVRCIRHWYPSPTGDYMGYRSN